MNSVYCVGFLCVLRLQKNKHGFVSSLAPPPTETLKLKQQQDNQYPFRSKAIKILLFKQHLFWGWSVTLTLTSLN